MSDTMSDIISVQEEMEVWIELQRQYNKDHNIDEGRLGWDHPVFDRYAKEQKEYDSYIQSPMEVEEGVLLCKKCGSRKVASYQVQSRAADEPMTTVATCTNCQAQWTENN